jgi:hypothetical protein
MDIILKYLLTYSTEHSPWKANWCLASQEIPRILGNTKFHYHVRKCMWPLPILSQLNLVHTPTSYFLKSILILSSYLCLGLPRSLFVRILSKLVSGVENWVCQVAQLHHSVEKHLPFRVANFIVYFIPRLLYRIPPLCLIYMFSIEKITLFIRQYDAPECKRWPDFKMTQNLPADSKTRWSYVSYTLNECHIHSGKYSNQILLHNW